MEVPTDSVCRLCLAVEAADRMFSLAPVQEIYENVTNNRLNSNKMPTTACYICYAQLKKCYKFIVKSTIAENTLVGLLQTQTDITPKSVCKVDRDGKGLKSRLIVTKVKQEVFPLKINVPVLVKNEPIMQDNIEIKVEVFDEMTVSDAEYFGGDIEEDNLPPKYLKDDDPGPSAAANIPESNCDQKSLPIGVDVESNEVIHKGPAKRQYKIDGLIAFTNSKHLKIRPGKSCECTVCKKRFKQKAQLSAHLRTHTGEKPFVCKICDNKFTQLSSLDRHLKAHRGEKKYECNICDKKFVQKSELIKHLRTHTGEKPYKCDICGKCFALKKHLTSHTRCHTGEKPYECELCGVRFKEGSHLKRHMDTHTGEKPFECDQCQRMFRRKCNLKSHLMIHSGVKPFSCMICKQPFKRKTPLRLHMLTHEKQNTINKSQEVTQHDASKKICQ